MLRAVPGSTTVAFPLEQLSYEYAWDIDLQLLTFNWNSATYTISVPVVSSGTLTFQYGTSPVTYTFPSSGVYTVTFTPSYNMITSVTKVSALPSNVALPEFPPMMILPLLVLLTMMVSVILRKRKGRAERLYKLTLTLDSLHSSRMLH